MGAAVVAFGVAAAAAPAAQAQGADEREDRSVLLILDASKSMNEDAGGGTTRLDAAKAAVRELMKGLPDDARVGLRVYGAHVSEVSRAEGCRDTRLEVPVGPLDRGALSARVEALQGKGRTPIGRSLLAAPGDLPQDGGRRTVILVSDGGDNCAPPDPCKAAREVARQGLDLTVSVVGLQVEERVRRQLRCIAEAGGGSYVDAGDAGALRRELQAAFARAFRSYELSGTPVTGGRDAASAARVGPGGWLDREGLRSGEEKFYAIRVDRGRRLFASASFLAPPETRGGAGWRMEILSPAGENVSEGGGANSVGGPIEEAVRSVESSTMVYTPVPAGEDPELPPGRYVVRVWLEEGLTGTVPYELRLQTLRDGEAPGLVREPGRVPEVGDRKPRAPEATPRPDGDRDGDGGGSGAPLVAAIGAAGLAIGGFTGWSLGRRRRPT